MAGCRQATSHYLNQCWPRSTSPYGMSGPQWVNTGTQILFHCSHRPLMSKGCVRHVSVWRPSSLSHHTPLECSFTFAWMMLLVCCMDRECHPSGHYWDFHPGALCFESSHCSSSEDGAPVENTQKVASPCLNSLFPGRFEWNSRSVIFKLILVITGWSISCEIVIKWMSLDLTYDKSTLVQIMACCL